MAITNPTKYVTTRRLGRFKEKLDGEFATKAELEAAEVGSMFQIYVDTADMHLKGKPCGYGTFEMVDGHLILHQGE